MKKLIAFVLVLVMCLSLVACGGPDKNTAIDAFNEANTAFAELANKVNADNDLVSAEDVEVLQEISEKTIEYSALLKSDEEISEEKINEIVNWGKEVKETIAEIKDANDIELFEPPSRYSMRRMRNFRVCRFVFRDNLSTSGQKSTARKVRMEGIIIGGIVALLLVWIISVQRRLTGMEENLKDAMKQVGVLLSSHLEALTALLDRSYAYVGRKSQELLSIVSSRRNVITADSNPTEVQAQERLIGEVLKDFSAMAERFPEMKRDEAIAKSLDAIDSYG